MRLFLRALLLVWGLFFLILGMSFLFDPVNAAAGFGLSANGPAGLAALRADMTAFFVVSAVCAIIGAWRYNGDILLVPIALFGIALIGRMISAVMDGTADGFWQPMLVEALSIVLLAAGMKLLPHHASLDEAEEGAHL